MVADKKLDIYEAEKRGYIQPRILKTGECAGIIRFVYTWGICVGISNFGYKTRFCFDEKEEALKALSEWTGFKDPPGNWIKQKGGCFDRDNPKYKQNVE